MYSGFHVPKFSESFQSAHYYCPGLKLRYVAVLIHHLGIGLEKSRDVIKDTTYHRGRSEEEQIGSDDEEQNEQVEIDPKEIVRICHNKVRSLGEMLKQLEKAATSKEAEISILKTITPVKKNDAKGRLQKHLLWGDRLWTYVMDFNAAKLAERYPRIGDLVYNPRSDKPFVSFVTGTTSSITNVINLEKDDFEGGYATSYLYVLDIPESVLIIK